MAPEMTASDPYDWTEDYHNGRFRWRRDPVLYDAFMADPDDPRFWSEFTFEGRNYGAVLYPAIWQVQRWDSEGDCWGAVHNLMELPGMG